MGSKILFRPVFTTFMLQAGRFLQCNSDQGFRHVRNNTSCKSACKRIVQMTYCVVRFQSVIRFQIVIRFQNVIRFRIVLFDFKLCYSISNCVIRFQIVLFDFKLSYSISNCVIEIEFLFEL
jgi:hypothetical protein